MSAAVARQQQQSGHGANSSTGSRMGTTSPVEKRVVVKAEGMLAIMLPPPLPSIYYILPTALRSVTSCCHVR